MSNPLPPEMVPESQGPQQSPQKTPISFDRSDWSPTRCAIQQSVEACLLSGDWRLYAGQSTEQLRLWTQEYYGVAHVKFCSSGTVAVELALRSLHLKDDDEVILAGYDFPGNFRAVDDAGGKVVLCDLHPSAGWCLTAEKLEECVGPNTRGVIVSHLHGETANMPSIMEWTQSRKIAVIEDACQTHGSLQAGKPLGTWGDIGVLSFGGSKLVSAGRGGAILTNNDLFAQRIVRYSDRGNDAFPLSEIQAAIVYPQCIRLSDDHHLRRARAVELFNGLSDIPWLELPSITPETDPAYYKIGLRLRDGERGDANDLGLQETQTLASRRDGVVDALVKHGIQIGPGFIGFANRSKKRYRTPHSLTRTQELSDSTMVLHHSHLLCPTTGQSSVARVLEAFHAVTPDELR